MHSYLLQDFIIKIELEKAENGSLGFALVGGKNGRAILIKAISPDSSADLDGRLQVGDILLKVVFVLHFFGFQFLYLLYKEQYIQYRSGADWKCDAALHSKPRRWRPSAPGGQRIVLGPCVFPGVHLPQLDTPAQADPESQSKQPIAPTPDCNCAYGGLQRKFRETRVNWPIMQVAANQDATGKNLSWCQLGIIKTNKQHWNQGF